MREGWEIKKLGDICDIKNGRSQKSVENPNGHYPIYGSGGVMGYADDFICKAGTTIVGRKGTINKPLFVDCDFWNVDTAFGLQPKPKTNPRFLFYTCKSIDFNRYNKSTTLPSLVKSDLMKINIPVPPVQEQEKIVAELDSLSGIIEKKKQQLKELDNLAQSIFYDMFGDPITNEKGWEVKCIGDVCSLKSGNSNANNSAPGDLPYVKVGDMGIPGNESRITTSSQFVSRDDNRKGIFPIGTTIFPKRGGAIYTNKKRLTAIEICCDLNTMGVIPNKEVLHPSYLFHYFLWLDLGTLCNGAAIPQLNNCDIAPLKIEVPSLDIQKTFARKIEAIEKQKELIKKSIQETETLYDSRTDYWFN